MLGKTETYETLDVVPIIRTIALAAARREKYIDITAYHDDDAVVRLHSTANILEQVNDGQLQLVRSV